MSESKKEPPKVHIDRSPDREQSIFDLLPKKPKQKNSGSFWRFALVVILIYGLLYLFFME